MKELETDFYSPVLDFFPRGRNNPDGLVDVRYESYGVHLLYEGDSHSLPLGTVIRHRQNDSGGLSLEFSGDVRYIGNSGGIGLILPENRWHTFTYNEIARVRKPDGTTVWENAYVPEGKRLLSGYSL